MIGETTKQASEGGHLVGSCAAFQGVLGGSFLTRILLPSCYYINTPLSEGNMKERENHKADVTRNTSIAARRAAIIPPTGTKSQPPPPPR